MPKKKKTEQQRAKDAARKREVYKIGRAHGLSAKDAKSAHKVQAAVETKRREKAKPKPPARRRTRKTSTERPGLAFPQQTRKDTVTFETFVAMHPDIKSARKAIDRYRKETGQSISNKLGFQRYREVRESGKRYEQVRFKSYGLDDSPFRIHPPYKSRYYYHVRYEVEVEGQPDTFDQYMFVTSRTKLNAYQVVEKVYEAFQQGQETGIDRYRALRILPDKIFILAEIDTAKGRAA